MSLQTNKEKKRNGKDVFDLNFNELPGLSQTQMEEWYHQAVAPNSSRLREGANAKLEPKFVSCDFQAGEAVMEYEALEWELNPQSMVHGGIIITGFDTSLGMLCHYYAYPNVLTTVSLSSTFVRPIRMGDTMVFHSKIKSFGRSLVTLEGKVYLKSTGELAATATATFKILHHKVKTEI